MLSYERLRFPGILPSIVFGRDTCASFDMPIVVPENNLSQLLSIFFTLTMEGTVVDVVSGYVHPVSYYSYGMVDILTYHLMCNNVPVAVHTERYILALQSTETD